MEQLSGKLEDIFDKRIFKKYSQILPKSYNIFYFLKKNSISCQFVFYIAKKQQDLRKSKLDTNKIIGYISGNITLGKVELDSDDIEIIEESVEKKLDNYPGYKKKILDALQGKSIKLDTQGKRLLSEIQTRYIAEDMVIAFVWTNPKFLGKGVGQFLMILAADFSKKNFSIEKVSLDDDSDMAWDKKKNMYVKLGLWYINEEPEPEMEGLTEKIVKKYTNFKKKYTDPDRKNYLNKPVIPFFKIN